MRIDGTQGAAPNGPNEPQAGKGARPQPPGVAAAKPAEALELDAARGKYVGLAATGESIDPAAVAEARKLLESGQLDTPEAALRAAEKLLDRGL